MHVVFFLTENLSSPKFHQLQMEYFDKNLPSELPDNNDSHSIYVDIGEYI